MSLLATIIPPPFSLIWKSSLNPLAYQIRLIERERESKKKYISVSKLVHVLNLVRPRL